MSERLDELKEALARLEQEAKTIEESRQKVLQEMAEINCPFKVGQRLVNRRGEKAEVAAVSHWNNPKYKIRIRKIGTNGRPHKVMITAWESDQWVLDVEVFVNGRPVKPIANAKIENS